MVGTVQRLRGPATHQPAGGTPPPTAEHIAQVTLATLPKSESMWKNLQQPPAFG